MSVYFSYNPNDRYRQRFRHRMAGMSMTAFIMIFGVVLGFFFGRQYALQNHVMLQSQVKSLTAEKTALENAMTELKAEALTATTRFEELQKIYKETIPEGPMQELVTLVHKQLEEGMDPQRLAFLVRSARPPRNCTDPEVLRIVLATPAYKGPESKASIGEGAVVIHGSGESARNAAGAPEAWFDPGKPVEVQFVSQDGRAEEKKGVMPIHHSLVAGSKEYRFTVTEGAKSFAKITYNSCDYP